MLLLKRTSGAAVGGFNSSHASALKLWRHGTCAYLHTHIYEAPTNPSGRRAPHPGFDVTNLTTAAAKLPSPPSRPDGEVLFSPSGQTATRCRSTSHAPSFRPSLVVVVGRRDAENYRTPCWHFERITFLTHTPADQQRLCCLPCTVVGYSSVPYPPQPSHA